ncbi:MAG: porin [Pyrinomonadaceae bacterium]
MNQRSKISMAVAGACALLGASAANAGIGFKAGAWDVDFSGNINAFYTSADCDATNASTNVVGGLACTNNGDDATAVRSGLLPSALVISAKTNQANFDIGVTVGFYPGINSVSGAPNANAAGTPVGLGNSGIDMRQNFLTFGQSWGTLKLGRDLGLFGSDAILSDMTLLGVGSPAGNAAPSNTSLGRIGLGYIYADWLPQITYISPKIGGGFQVSAGVFSPMTIAGGPATSQEDPQFQGKVTWDFSGPVTGRLWAGAMYQEQTFVTPVAGNSSFDGQGYDVGAKIGFGPAEIVGYYYTGEGIGTTALFINPVSAAGEERDSDGYYVQGTVKFGPTKLGLSYGVSSLDLASGEAASNLVDENTSWVFGIYHALTSSVNLVFEYIDTESESHLSSVEADDQTWAIGAILFF